MAAWVPAKWSGLREPSSGELAEGSVSSRTKGVSGRYRAWEKVSRPWVFEIQLLSVWAIVASARHVRRRAALWTRPTPKGRLPH